MKDRFNDKDLRYINLYLDIADRISQMSYATRLQVGSVIVKNGNIISMGWNGMPTGFTNVCEYYDENNQLKTRPEVLHSEENAICKLAQSGFSCESADMFCTHSCCIQCAKLIARSGIKKFYYNNIYRDISGINFLINQNVKVYHFPR